MDNYIEKYAKDVGLVYREIKDLYAAPKVDPITGLLIPVEQRIEKGVIPNGMLFTPVIKCYMSDFQYKAYTDVIKNASQFGEYTHKRNISKYESCFSKIVSS